MIWYLENAKESVLAPQANNLAREQNYEYLEIFFMYTAL